MLNWLVGMQRRQSSWKATEEMVDAGRESRMARRSATHQTLPSPNPRGALVDTGLWTLSGRGPAD